MAILLDIYGNNININNSTPFLVLKIQILNNNNNNNIEQYLELLEKDLNIYRGKNLNNLFKKNNLDIKNFVLSSDIIVNSKLILILFINKNIGIYPKDYIKSYEKNIWIPRGSNEYSSIGLLYSKEKPKLNEILLIPNKLLIKTNNINYYNSLSNKEFGYWNIDKTQLLNSGGKYLTKLNKKNKLKNQIIKYTINGDLIIDNKCASVDENNQIVFDECFINNKNNKNNKNKNNKNNKWSLLNNNIISRRNNMCLTINKNNINLNMCNSNNKNQKFTQEQNQERANLVASMVGKNVFLTNNDNPWYDNLENNNLENINLENNLENNNINLVQIYDNTQDLQETNLIENFNFNINNNKIIYCIIFIAIILIILIYKKKHLFIKL